MKKYYAASLMLLLFVISCKKTAVDPGESTAPERFTSQQIDAFIKTTLEAEHKFEWNSASDAMVWSALQESDLILSVGYKPADENSASIKLENVDINDARWVNAKNEVLNMILAEEQKADNSVAINKLIQWEENVLPVMDIRVTCLATVQKLRASKLVRYAEPMGYEPKEVSAKVLSSSGCNNAAEPGLAEGADYTTILPATKQSWNYSYHNIPKAWSKTSGAGVKVFFVDTGCEFDQENLGSAFNQGYSSGRTIEKIVTLPRNTFLGIPIGSVETPDDGCGHGTSMAGACGAPRGTDGAACGVAYNCNLITCRASYNAGDEW